jgi:hypothetical protein
LPKIKEGPGGKPPEPQPINCFPCFVPIPAKNRFSRNRFAADKNSPNQYIGITIAVSFPPVCLPSAFHPLNRPEKLFRKNLLHFEAEIQLSKGIAAYRPNKNFFLQ